MRERGTNLFHDTGLALGEGDVATRLVGDELDLDLPALATRLIIIVVVVVGGRGTLAFDTTVLARGIAIPDGVVVEARWGGRVVLVGDVGHGGDDAGRQHELEGQTEMAGGGM